jgi:putative flippase GtrA
LADSTLLYLLVRFAGLPVLRANLISATTAALLVFLLSRKLVFNAPATHLGVRLLIYSGYTLLVIVAASAAMKYISFGAFSLSRHFGYPLATSTCALVAKIVVTPPNFLLNYAVARITSEHGNTTV